MTFLFWHIFKGWTIFNKNILLKNVTYKYCGKVKVKFHIPFYGDYPWFVGLRQMKCGAIKEHGHTYKFYLNRFLFHEFFKYGNVAKH
jgi:hypothetical protein